MAPAGSGGGTVTPQRAAVEDGWVRRGFSVSLQIGRPRRNAGEGSGDSPAHSPPGLEANPQAGGTVRPNTGTRPAGGGPPMAGHVCESVSGSATRQRRDRRCEKRPFRVCRGRAGRPEAPRRVPLEACVFENWVSEIVQAVAAKTAPE